MEIKHILRAVGLSLPSESEGKWRGGPRSLRLGQERLLVTLRVSPLHPSIRAQPTAVRNLPESTLGWNADLCLCTPVCMCSGMLHLLAGAGVRAHRWLCEGQENVSLMYICGPRGFVKVVFFFLAVLGLRCCTQQAGATLRCGPQASHCGGFSCCGAQALDARASGIVARGLQ